MNDSCRTNECNFFRQAMQNPTGDELPGETRYQLGVSDTGFALKLAKRLVGHASANATELPVDIVDRLLAQANLLATSAMEIRTDHNLVMVLGVPETEVFVEALEISDDTLLRRLGGVISTQLETDRLFSAIADSESGDTTS